MADHVPAADVPLAGNVVSVMLSLTTFGVLAVCLTRRIQNITTWRKLPLATWLIIIIYVDSTLFVFVTDVIARGFGINKSVGICEGGILLCLVCYMSTKILIYYFLVERAYIIRGSRRPRMQTKLWMFNCLVMLFPYVCVVIMNFVFRIAYINDDGVCIIGMEKIAMMPLIIFDVVVNVYLTLLFIIPLRNLYSYQHGTNRTLRMMAFRSFIGSCVTLTSSVVNLTVLMVLKGEPGWICLMCCNADILFCVLILHWVTQVDNSRENTRSGSHGDSAIDRKDISLQSPNTPRFDSDVPKSRRESISIWPGQRLSEPKKALTLAGTITTECKGATHHHKGRESEDEIVELHKIRVQTEQTQEVEIEQRSMNSDRDYHAYGPERTVSAEKMV
ncbi:hypothetical protein BS50DRAFT_120103 [Corynespora cassiicola Philippines]|uniref:G-protein coupled receptors family 1 profile domain-containing protein n=1 Tax=Corynespora cassiicola Philippines TaxID=1448308 RepID=A0A2T2NAU2_CORCC|nr:hypothetical protein BS50DRAFT_120103 [Corynespora cassiicola Philippines]